MLTHSHSQDLVRTGPSTSASTPSSIVVGDPSTSPYRPPPLLRPRPRSSALRLSNPTNVNVNSNSSSRRASSHIGIGIYLGRHATPYTQPRPIMSRATNRPTHIPMPNSPFNGRSPNGTPLPTPNPNANAASGATSPTSPRSPFIPSFIRTRSRAATLTGAGRGRASPTVEAANPLGQTPSRSGAGAGVGMPAVMAEGMGVTRSVSSPNGVAVVVHPTGNRNQTGEGYRGPAQPTTTSRNEASTAPVPKNLIVSAADRAIINAAQPPRPTSDPPTTYRIRLVPHLENTRSLAFDPVMREVLPIVIPAGMDAGMVAHNIDKVPNAVNGRPPALILKIGRFTDRPNSSTAPNGAGGSNGAGSSNTNANSAIGSGPMSTVMTVSGGGGDICSARVAFKSKVVSRSHAEIWCEPGGKVSPHTGHFCTLVASVLTAVLYTRYVQQFGIVPEPYSALEPEQRFASDADHRKLPMLWAVDLADI